MQARWLNISAILVLTSFNSARGDETLARDSGCLKCHDIESVKVGPAYQDVAARYADDPAAREDLIETVKRGGKGHWTEVTGEVLMPPHAGRLTDEQIERLVDWVLGMEN